MMKTTQVYRNIPCFLVFTMLFATGLSLKAQVSAGYDFYLASCDGELSAWGEGSWGTLGDGQAASNMVPVTVQGLNDVVQFSSSENFSLAVKADGTLWSWGGNQHGQLGLGDTDSRSIPAMVTGIPPVVEAHAGRWWGMALTVDGTVYSWGRGDAGSLGTGDFGDVLSPVQINGLENVERLYGGYSNGFAVLGSGAVMCWGYNEWNCMGFSSGSSVVPTPVSTPLPGEVIGIAGGYWNTIALLADSTLVAAGANNFGQLALGTTTMTFAWVPIPDLSKIVNVRCANSHCLAINDVGQLYTWGYNQYGQVGNGNNQNQLTPYLHTDLEPVIWADGGERQSIIQTVTGDFYTFGHVVAGTFENGSLIHSNSPTLITNEVCSTSSLANNQDQMLIQVYPNPSNGSVIINHETNGPGMLRVFDTTGRLVYSSVLIAKSTSLEMEHLNAGVYIMQLESEGKIHSTKLVIH